MTSHTNWKRAVDSLEQLIGPASKKQRLLAEASGLELQGDEPRLVVSALLRLTLGEELGLAPGSSSLEGEWFDDFVDGMRSSGWPVPEIVTREEYGAWKRVSWVEARIAALRELKLGYGDIVSEPNGDRPNLPEYLEVSSIGDDGRVHFKGGRGRWAWPDQLQLVAKASETSEDASEYRRLANNAAAQMQGDWGVVSALQKLGEDVGTFTGWLEAGVAVSAFDHALGQAEDEKPMQKVLEEHPKILGSLLSGTFRFVVPRKRLGTSHETDFLLASVNSIGVRWVLVELESPTAPLRLEKKNLLAEKVRIGVGQINDWRDWLQENLALARRSTSGGLGLVDIDPQADGLVIVGRRGESASESSALRRGEWSRSRIRIHTYDWLREQLRGALEFSGPPGANRLLLDHDAWG